MDVFRFVIQLELSSSLYKLGVIQLNCKSGAIQLFNNDWESNGSVAEIFFSQLTKWMTDVRSQNLEGRPEIYDLVHFFRSGRRMIQIKKVKSDEGQIDEIVCPFFIIDPYNFKFNVVPGTNRLKFVNQGKEIIELEPETEYIFTLKKRSKFSLNFLWFLCYFVLI